MMTIKIIILTVLLSTSTSLMSASGNDLVEAAERNDKSYLQKAITNGVDINSHNSNGATILMAAAIKGHSELVTYLLDRDANPNILNNQGIGPLYAACMFGYTDIASNLLKKGANPNVRINTPNATPLFAAVLNYRKEIVKLLLKNGAELNIKNSKGQIVIEVADDKEINEILVNHQLADNQIE